MWAFLRMPKQFHIKPICTIHNSSSVFKVINSIFLFSLAKEIVNVVDPKEVFFSLREILRKTPLCFLDS